jgi:pilus assembly protein CpaC
VRAKTGFLIACLSVVVVVLCAGLSLQAQTSPSLSQPAGSAVQDSTNDLSVTVGKSVLIDCAQMIARVAVGSSDTAEASAIGRNEIMVTAKAPGETSLIIWDINGGRQFFNVTVLAADTVTSDKLAALRRELKDELPGQSVKVSTENGSIFLRGTVKDLNSSQRAVKVASAAGKVVNMLDVAVPAADPQILLKVRFASIDRNKSKQLGLNFVSTGLANTTGLITTGQFSPPTVTTASGVTTATLPSNELNLLAMFPGNLPMGVDIEALETKGVVEVLAQPNIVAANGKEASFLAGGEYPYPVAQPSTSGGSTVTIMFKEYGVRLNFIPTITPRGTIRLQVAPEVSALDFSNELQIAGFTVPAITTRKVNTEVEMADGQSFVIGGLLDNRETETFNKIPFLGDIPILGKFFQSMTKNRTNTELIVIVTPEIVAPIAAGEAVPDLKYPVKFLPPNSGTPMNNPDAKTPANTPAPAPATIPVETLIDSMKPETPLVIEGGASGFGASSTTTQGTSTTTTSTPATTP